MQQHQAHKASWGGLAQEGSDSAHRESHFQGGYNKCYTVLLTFSCFPFVCRCVTVTSTSLCRRCQYFCVFLWRLSATSVMSVPQRWSSSWLDVQEHLEDISPPLIQFGTEGASWMKGEVSPTSPAACCFSTERPAKRVFSTKCETQKYMMNRNDVVNPKLIGFCWIIAAPKMFSFLETAILFAQVK